MDTLEPGHQPDLPALEGIYTAHGAPGLPSVKHSLNAFGMRSVLHPLTYLNTACSSASSQDVEGRLFSRSGKGMRLSTCREAYKLYPSRHTWLT